MMTLIPLDINDTNLNIFDSYHVLVLFCRGEIVLNNDRPQSIHADSIMHSSTIHPPQVDRPSHSPTSFSLTTASIEYPEMHHKKFEPPLKDHENKVRNN